LRFAAYLLVTYAIEVRADEFYPIYQDALDNAAGSKVNVKSIILEEEGHLEEMINQLANTSRRIGSCTLIGRLLLKPAYLVIGLMRWEKIWVKTPLSC
jgi:hypothetical protein